MVIDLRSLPTFNDLNQRIIMPRVRVDLNHAKRVRVVKPMDQFFHEQKRST